MNNFICKRCGQCCGVIWFTKAEYKAVQRTAKNMGITLVKEEYEGVIIYLPRSTFRKLTLPKDKLDQLIDNGGLDCPFLAKDNAGQSICRIYNLRPIVCRQFGTRPDLSPRLKCPNQEKK